MTAELPIRDHWRNRRWPGFSLRLAAGGAGGLWLLLAGAALPAARFRGFLASAAGGTALGWQFGPGRVSRGALYRLLVYAVGAGVSPCSRGWVSPLATLWVAPRAVRLSTSWTRAASVSYGGRPAAGLRGPVPWGARRAEDRPGRAVRPRSDPAPGVGSRLWLRTSPRLVGRRRRIRGVAGFLPSRAGAGGAGGAASAPGIRYRTEKVAGLPWLATAVLAGFGGAPGPFAPRVAPSAVPDSIKAERPRQERGTGLAGLCSRWRTATTSAGRPTRGLWSPEGRVSDRLLLLLRGADPHKALTS